MDIVYALRKGGCTADLALLIPGLRPDVVGVHIGIRGEQSPPRSYYLARILYSADVQFTYAQMEKDFFPSDDFVLVIGSAN